MNSITKKKSIILLSVGMLIIALTQIFAHYVELSDLIKGSFTGIGIGILLIVLTFGKSKLIRSN
ncbi:hypothetical protein ATE84_2485 [Aquimarina sp. MAR_2010_214]|uniref:hypothetical protein n=1 Tax=Aquimarina sp. MAR_2010_214 TaxID=1250026 RepID=UPI000C70D01E|nr:hypothetical protein [Aquimarina sp. MAR_2010_214]PKV50428.1 hypothetical protein ATE84_2485 [Aquimarina sp. MAR_2010_214]